MQVLHLFCGMAVPLLFAQVYAILVQGGFQASMANDVADGLLHRGIIFGRLRVLSFAGRLLWLHVRHPAQIDSPRARALADAYFTGRLLDILWSSTLNRLL